MNLKLKSLRRAKDLTQAQLAEKVGTTLRVVSSWERGETALPLEDACAIADVLECTLDELAGSEWPRGNPALAPDERQLVGDYRRIDDADRPALLATASAMAFAGDAKKEGDGAPAGLVGQDVKEAQRSTG